MTNQKLSILGSTGSIGRQALSLVDELGITVESLTAHRDTATLEQQVLRHRPRFVCVVDEKQAAGLKISLGHTSTKVLSGADGLCRLMEMDDSDTVLSSIVGIAGLRPTLCALERGRNVALANKETLVSAGGLVTGTAASNGCAILPVDSEHSAIFQCLQGAAEGQSLHRIFLTASGGPFFGYARDQLEAVTPEQALRHPNWVMGKKVTIDSATLMNKGLELIEAMWLFSVRASDIVITVHQQSIVHSMVEFRDHSVLAQLSQPDMRLPIQYALTWPRRLPCPVPPLDVHGMPALTFEKPDDATFRCLYAARRAAEKGGLAPCAANAANEVAVELFLEGRIGFLDIGELVCEAVEGCASGGADSLESILETDALTRQGIMSQYI